MPGSSGNLIYRHVMTIISNLLSNHGHVLDFPVPQFWSPEPISLPEAKDEEVKLLHRVTEEHT